MMEAATAPAKRRPCNLQVAADIEALSVGQSILIDEAAMRDGAVRVTAHRLGIRLARHFRTWRTTLGTRVQRMEDGGEG